MPRDFKISSPLDQVAELRRAAREARQADALAEQAVMRAFEVYRTLKFGQAETPEKVLDRLDRASDQLGSARFALGDASYQIEQLLRETGNGT